MAFIKIIPPGKASGETAEVYKQLARVTGQSMVPKIVQIFSLRPGSMRRMIRLWELSMWIGQAPRQNREMVAAAVSRSNRCYYWIDAHEANLQAAGGQATRVARLMDGTAGNITALERELITLVRKSVEQPMRLIPSDLDPVRDFVGDDALRQEGYDDLGILDLSIAIADANMWARFYRLLDLEAGLFYLT